jgi:hypothetical protein
MSVSIRGPMAVVDVDRSLQPEDDRHELLFDLALPDAAAMLDWRVTAEGRALHLAPADPTRARADHAAALTKRGLGGPRAAIDEGTDFRFHLVGLRAGGVARLHYRYVVPLACRHGRFLLHVPGSLEADPAPAEVTVAVAAPGLRIEGLELAGVSARGNGAHGQAPARAAWDLSFALGGARPEPILAASAPLAPHGADTGVALGVCRMSPAEGPAPERVLLLVDRSRSVGPAGISLERDVARALLEALPPSVRFNALFFDRAVTPLFPVARAATAEALAALDEQTGPGQLENGTDLSRALKAAGELGRIEPEARTWVVLLTDGALPEGARADSLLLAASAFAPSRTEALVLLVRPGGDEPTPAAAQEVLRALPGRFGGVLRAVDAADVRGTVAQVIAAARRGGDLFGISVAAGGRGTEVLAAVAPGEGDTRIVRVAGGGALSSSAQHAGRATRAALATARVDRAALAPYLDGPAGAAWIAAGGRLAAYVETAAGPPPLADETPRGQMDRNVVRNALSLAYMPRARACYLGRRVRGADDFELRGRLRLELHLERGEMVEAVVRQSTLKRPEIEACLREAAFGVEIPRPLHRDAPVVAALNLVFQPRTAAGTPDASALGREIDLLLGPISFPSDPRDLLDQPASP